MGEQEATAVEEVQGLYGPFQFPELLLQKIWAERAFRAAGARTEQGESVRVIRAGRWNRQEGPDFKHAEIEIDGQPRAGDIELHLREPDWRTHGHAEDRNYDNVVLHVVLFPPSRATSVGANGQLIPILTLLPLLWHDLEEYAADAAVSRIADRPADRLAQAWLELSPEACRARIIAAARARWQGKVHYARLRVKRLGWSAACHHAALEILGYRFNRVPMLTVATRWPLAAWAAGEVDPEDVFVSMADQWRLGAVRPANHPRRRLLAYQSWTRHAPDWPAALEAVGRDWPDRKDELSPESEVADLRRRHRLKVWWREVMARVGVDGVVAQPRADNLWGDGLLPLLAAAEILPEAEAFLWWYMSWPGDQAANLAKAARLIGVADGRSNPLAWGHMQGLIGQQLAATQSGGAGDLTSDFTRE